MLPPSGSRQWEKQDPRPADYMALSIKIIVDPGASLQRLHCGTSLLIPWLSQWASPADLHTACLPHLPGPGRNLELHRSDSNSMPAPGSGSMIYSIQGTESWASQSYVMTNRRSLSSPPCNCPTEALQLRYDTPCCRIEELPRWSASRLPAWLMACPSGKVSADAREFRRNRWGIFSR